MTQRRAWRLPLTGARAATPAGTPPATARDGDVGSILGWGFAPWTGGIFSYMDGIGLARFVRECEAMGEDPPEPLRRMAREGRSFHDGA